MKKVNKKIMLGSLQGNWTVNQKIYGVLYAVMCKDTAYIPYLSVNIFSMISAVKKLFNAMSEKKILILLKNTTILKLEERLDHSNDNVYLLNTSIYASINSDRKKK